MKSSDLLERRTVGIAEPCHGATTMTASAASVLLIDESDSKLNMWGGLRCNRIFLILFLIHIIAFQTYVYYQEQCKWQEVKENLMSIMTERQELWSELELLVNKEQDVYKLIIKLLEGQGVHGVNRTQELADKPIIYAVTPTFARPVQKAELTRLAQTFLHIPNFHWILVEDSVKKTKLVTQFLQNSGLRYTHLAVATPLNYKLGRTDPNWKKPRGVEQRNAALNWLRDNLKLTDKGIVYFADDDNTYSVKLFHEMEKVRKVGVWPVGLVGGLMVEKPMCDNITNKVIGFNAVWKPDRPFPLDMAGFAINLRLLLENKDALFSYEVEGGYQESEILRQIVTRDELEPLADHCTKVYVWHTRTEPPQLSVEQLLIKKGKRSNIGIEV
ncbi:galactosylgalactosylxylosylprotein 3-beta-glucuronosyltransferase I [Hylaeus anthracinus]|uniref:galactosylgalactosylxylosylprotein 3-beta-glucuronosyltransferase I n=1 Tax=Hylaeus anthracinus TaxID=313031 RepID=UPI0023BA1C6D|nr:galactosylgalactosylxylosylprotein 3-beta-glucuronosyltransferase I [Hylaeus anthracinus]